MMGGGGGGGNEGEADRWLNTAEKLLLSGDLNGSKTYAIRACEADHSLVDPAELILAVADTLIAGESRIRGSTADLPDWYAVLRLVRLTHNPELVATQYNRLAVLLDPSRNRFPYSDQAFRLISDAWYVLSDPSRKALYDRELHLSQFGQLGQLGFQLFNQPPESSPQHQQQQQSPQHLQTMSFQSQQLPFQLHQQPQQHSHFAQPQQQQRSQFDQQLMQSQSLQEQQQASWRQQFGQEQSEPIRSSSSNSGREWKLPLEEEGSINLNNATERVQHSRRFHEPDRSSIGRSYEASSHRTPSTDLTWPSSKPSSTSEPVHWQSSEPARQYQQSSSNEAAAQLSLLTSVSEQASGVSQQARSHVSKPQPVAKPAPVSNSFLMSQPPPTSKPFAVSQPSQKSKPFPMSQPSPTSKPFPASQPTPTSNPFPASQPSQKPQPFPVSQLSQKPQPFPVSQSPQNSKPFLVSQPQPTSNLFSTSQPSSKSKPFPLSQPPPTTNPFPVSQPTANSKVSNVSQPPPASKPFPVSQPPLTSNPFQVTQPPTTSKPFPVSQPLTTSKPFPVSQPPTSSKPLPVSQPPEQAFQSTRVSQPPEASSCHSPLPHVFNSIQSFQPPPVSTTPTPVPAISTNQSPPPPPPVSQPTWVPNQTPATEQTRDSGTARSDSDPKVPTFWTICPYCFVLYEYPNHYEESVLLCQTTSCRRAFQAVKVPSPPPVAGEDTYYCCWGFYPIGFTETTKFPVNDLPKSAPRGFSTATKAPVFDLPKSAPKKPSPKVYYHEDEDDDSYIDSDPSEDDDDDDDDDWQMNGTKRRKNVKQSKQIASKKPKLGRPRKVIQGD